MYKDVESATVGEPITLHFATNAWMENIYMYLGEDEIAHWTEENAEQVTASETYKEWTVTHTFEEPGTMNVWFKAANADGEMSNAYNFDPIEVVPAESATIFELDDVEYALIEGGASIHAYKGSSAVVTIPETVMYEDASYTVIEVGESAFEGNTTLTSIDLPDTIQVIRRRAFANCTALANMN